MPDEIITLLREGIALERRGLREYLKFARRTKSETGKNMFITLASDEVDHAQILEDQLVHYQENKTWHTVHIETSQFQKIVGRIAELSQKKEAEGVEEKEALRLAMDLELRAVEYYKRGLEKASDNSLREMFQKFVTMEEAHYAILNAELDSIEKNSFWFDIPEFRLEME